MIRVTSEDMVRHGGFLSALSDASVEYMRSQLGPSVKWTPSMLPERLVVHKAPHLDDYFAEMLFRAALDRGDRPSEFLEMALYSEDDSTAATHWPTAAVFGIGADKPSGKRAQILFDEHQHGGGRTDESCAHLVAKRCFGGLPDSCRRLLGEIGAIDSAGGAHPLHLNNLLKTCHVAQYEVGKAVSGQARATSLTDSWKRAVVNAAIASVAFCLDQGFDFTEAGRVRSCIKRMLTRFGASIPTTGDPVRAKSFERLRSIASDTSALEKRARVTVEGREEAQLLVAPFIAVAAEVAWGPEIAYFVMAHLWEPEVERNVHFARVTAMVERAFADPHSPRSVTESQCDVTGIVLKGCTFRGYRRVNDRELAARFPSPIWICACQHTNQVLQPNKALMHFLNEKNWGVGIVLSRNTKEGSMAMFRGRALSEQYWDAIIGELNRIEPGLWYRPQPTAPFVVNGNAAHQYVQRSALTPTHLASLCRRVYG